MKSGKVLPFPKEQSTRARLRDRASQQRAGLALSILSVLTISIVLNQWLTKPSEVSAAGRGIASYEGPKDANAIKWEHELALQLSRSENTQGQLGVKPTLSDDLIFGALEGRYGAQLKEGRVASLEFAAGDAAGTLRLSDRESFLLKYRGAFAVSFDQVSLMSSGEGQEVWGLYGGGKTLVGRATFAMDPGGHVTTVHVDR